MSVSEEGVNTDKFIEAGRLVGFSTGEYSDYSFNSLFLGVKDMTRGGAQELAKAVAKEHKRAEVNRDKAFDAWHKSGAKGDPPEWVGGIHGYFIDRLISGGYLLTIDYTEHHIGSYGELSV